MLSAREDSGNKAISIIYQFSLMLGLLERRSALCERIKPEDRLLLNSTRSRCPAVGRKIEKLANSGGDGEEQGSEARLGTTR